MAKRNRQVQQRGTDFRATELLDDNLLPSPEDLIKYKEVDPSIIEFLKERAKIEQETRHEFNREIIKLNKREQKLTHGLNYAALFCGLIIILSAMFLSYTLITNGQVVTGSVFGGIGILYVAYLFISVINRKATPPNQ